MAASGDPLALWFRQSGSRTRPNRQIRSKPISVSCLTYLRLFFFVCGGGHQELVYVNKLVAKI